MCKEENLSIPTNIFNVCRIENLQSKVQDRLEVVCRLKVIRDDCRCLSLLTLGIGIRAFQHQINVISGK